MCNSKVAQLLSVLLVPWCSRTYTTNASYRHLSYSTDLSILVCLVLVYFEKHKENSTALGIIL